MCLRIYGLVIFSFFFRDDVEQFASKVLGRRLELITVCCHGDRKKFQSVVSCALNNAR